MDATEDSGVEVIKVHQNNSMQQLADINSSVPTAPLFQQVISYG